MSRRLLVFGLLIALLVTSLPLRVSAQSGPPKVPDTMTAYSIVPPGQEGNVTPEEVAAGTYGEHFRRPARAVRVADRRRRRDGR